VKERRERREEVKRGNMFYPEGFIKEQEESLRGMIGEGKAVIPVSGGITTTVAAVLTHRAVGDQALIVVVDDGLMRTSELERAMVFFTAQAISPRWVDATQEFLDALNGLDEPEEQRKVYRDTFYSVLGRVIREEKAQYLVQGTTAADVVRTEEGMEIPDDIFEQSGIRAIDPRTYGLTVLEPLRKLNRHEIRKVARSLGLSPAFLDRQPFPVVVGLLRPSLVK